MKTKAVAGMVLALTLLQPAWAGGGDEADSSGADRGFLYQALFYIPNRVFDLLDMVRLRVRVGPGVALDVRATEAADLFLGGYTSVYAGIPGPRGEPSIPLPAGIENRAGAEVSVADLTADAGLGPGYGATEFGLGAQLVIVGADVGVDPLEIVDFLAGLLFLDLVGDDL